LQILDFARADRVQALERNAYVFGDVHMGKMPMPRTSCGGNDPQSPLAIGGERQACADVLCRQVREVGENLIGRHSRGKVFEHVSDRDPQATDARLPTSLICLNRDEMRVIHNQSLMRAYRAGQTPNFSGVETLAPPAVQEVIPCTSRN
jgi:hypothetical protein